MINILYFVAILITSSYTFSAPVPGFGSAPAHQLLKNILVSELGFRIGNSQQSFWILKDETSFKIPNTHQFIASNPQLSARFLINIDKFSKPMTLEAYLKKWIKEYPYFGFEVLQTQSFKLSGQSSYLVDLAHRKKNKQLRQFVVVKDDYAIVMTCVDEISQFKETSIECGKLINNFEWIARVQLPLQQISAPQEKNDSPVTK